MNQMCLHVPAGCPGAQPITVIIHEALCLCWMQKHMKLYTGGKKSAKSERQALLMLKRGLGNLENSKVNIVEPIQ